MFPENLHELVLIPDVDEFLSNLVNLAEQENWNKQDRLPEDREHQILYNYLKYTYKKLVEEGKIEIADDGASITFNTGLVTSNQEPIFIYANQNRNPDSDVNWFFQGWKRKAEYELARFSALPEMASYFDDPTHLVFDTRKDLRVNIGHIINDNKMRFPDPYNQMDDYQLQTFLKGAIDNAKQRVKRNYKTAIPQYYRGSIQLLLPLCISNPNTADLALVVENMGDFYRASTCLTLDMAYNNARQLARPDRDWLIP